MVKASVARKPAKRMAKKATRGRRSAELMPRMPKPTDKLPAKPFHISERVLEWARRKHVKQADIPEPLLYFAPAEPPPQVVPEGEPELAMDDALNGVVDWVSGWGPGYFSSIIEEGQTFLGYPYLAALTQRPEYRRISETVATEATRKWIKLTATGNKDKTEEIKQLDAELKRLGAEEAFRKISEVDGFFGRAHLYIDTDQTDDRDELQTSILNAKGEPSKAKIKRGSVKALRVVEPMWTYPANYNSNNPLKPDWYNPTQWFVMGTQLHSSRLMTFIGREVPDMLKPAYSFGGLSLSQMAKPYVDNWLRTRQSVSDITAAFSVMVLMTNLQTILQGGADNSLFQRADLFNLIRDNKGLMLVDKDTEDFKNVSAPLGTLDALQAQSQEHICSVSGIPLVKYTGIQPAGLNASSDGEIRVWYDLVHAYQKKFFSPKLTLVIQIAMLNIWGKIDPEIGFEYVPLYSMTEKESADLEKTKADTDAIYAELGAIDATDIRKRIAGDKNSQYAGIEADDVPDATEEEASELEDGEAATEDPDNEATGKQERELEEN